MKRLNLLLTAGFMAIATMGYAQPDGAVETHTVTVVIPEVALVDVEPDGANTISMSFTAPAEAGSPLTAPTDDNTLWLNYTSIVADATVFRTVTASATGLPSGVTLQVTAATASGAGFGVLGATANQITLSGTEQSVLTGIGSCYTGTGTTNGSQLTYAASVANADYGTAFITAGSNVTVQYTITDDL